MMVININTSLLYTAPLIDSTCMWIKQEDFMGATAGRKRIINFSTQPTWLYKGPLHQYPDNSEVCDWSYPQGSELADASMTQLGDYYGRLLAWYTQGGFVDEFGVKHTSGHYYDIQYWVYTNHT
jgi:hypothetical protein